MIPLCKIDFEVTLPNTVLPHTTVLSILNVDLYGYCLRNYAVNTEIKMQTNTKRFHFQEKSCMQTGPKWLLGELKCVLGLEESSMWHPLKHQAVTTTDTISYSATHGLIGLQLGSLKCKAYVWVLLPSNVSSRPLWTTELVTAITEDSRIKNNTSLMTNMSYLTCLYMFIYLSSGKQSLNECEEISPQCRCELTNWSVYLWFDFSWLILLPSLSTLWGSLHKIA